MTPNCKRYKWVDPNFVCVECSSDTYLSPSNTCVSTCTTVLKRKFSFDDPANKAAIESVMKNNCDAANGDKIYHNDSAQADQLAVGFCAAGKIGTYNAFASSFNYALNEFTLGYSYPTYGGCVDYAAGNSFPPANSATNFCQQYFKKADNNFYCVNCQRGYTGKVEVNGTYSYVTCDTKVDGCTNDIYGGFYIGQKSKDAHDIKTDLFYSCHKCSSTNIPFLHISTVGAKVKHETFKPFNME